MPPDSNLIVKCINFLISPLKVLYSLLYGFNQSPSRSSHCISDVVIVSHYTNPDQRSSEYDQYYGELVTLLGSSDIKVTVIYIDHTPQRLNFFQSLDFGKSYNSVPAKRRITFAEISALINSSITAFFEIVALTNVSFFSKVNLLNSIFNGSSIFSFRLVYLILDILNQSSARVLITTFEGHAWERQLIAKFKQLSNYRCAIGYVHSFIHKQAFSIKNPFSIKFQPDVILYSGKAQYQSLCFYYPNSDHIISGNFTFSPISFPIDELQPSAPSRVRVLLIPEGIKYEHDFLFNWGYAFAKSNANFDVVFRPHPILRGYAEKSFKLIKLSNFLLDKQDLARSAFQSHFAIYRASAAVLQCIECDCYPIYIHDGKIDVDPIDSFCSINYTDTFAAVSNMLLSIYGNNYSSLKTSSSYREKPNLSLVVYTIKELLVG